MATMSNKLQFVDGSTVQQTEVYWTFCQKFVDFLTLQEPYGKWIIDNEEKSYLIVK